MSLPVISTQQTNLKMLHLAFEGLLLAAVAILHGGANLPPAFVTAFQWLSFVGDIEHPVGGHVLRIPDVANTFAGLFLC